MRRALLALALFLGLATQVTAQEGDALLSRAIDAYRALDYEVAIGYLRRSLAREGTERLPDSLRAEAFVQSRLRGPAIPRHDHRWRRAGAS